MALVQFKVGSSAQFQALTTKDDNTLYFLTDTRKVFKGSVPYGGGFYQSVTALPATSAAELNTLYLNTSDNSISFFDGTKFVTVGSNADITELKNKVKTIQGDETVNGSINYALKQAKDYADNQDSALKTTLESKIDKKFNTPTEKTIAGFGITDAYTKTETDSAISTAVANADHLKRAIVSTLPDVSTADVNTIYMVPQNGATTGSQTSNYNEYIIVNGAFELIGTSAVDLTGYATKKYADDKASDAETAAKSYADGLAKNYATANQGKAADAAVKTIKSGSTYVNIVTTDAEDTTVNAQNPKINLVGLGDVITHNASEFATKAQGNLADSSVQSVTGSTYVSVGTNTKNPVISLTGVGDVITHNASEFGSSDDTAKGVKAYDTLQWGTIA